MRFVLLSALSIGLILAGVVFAEPCATQPMTLTSQVPGDQPGRSRVPDLVKALGDPNNDVRAKAAEALRRILPSDPSAAPNWHDKAFWSKRIEKTKPDMLLKDALAILLPELSAEERKKTEIGGEWSGQTGVNSYQLDDYWRVTIQLKDLGQERLNGIPELTPGVRAQWVEPAKDFTGLWVTWYVNGQKANEIEYRDGKYDGMFTSFHDDGSKSTQQHNKRHVADGASLGWYKSGKRAYEGQYKDDKQDGAWRFWYENGQLQSETTYSAGQPVGGGTRWLENGQKQ